MLGLSLRIATRMRTGASSHFMSNRFAWSEWAQASRRGEVGTEAGEHVAGSSDHSEASAGKTTLHCRFVDCPCLRENSTSPSQRKGSPMCRRNGPTMDHPLVGPLAVRHQKPATHCPGHLLNQRVSTHKLVFIGQRHVVCKVDDLHLAVTDVIGCVLSQE